MTRPAPPAPVHPLRLPVPATPVRTPAGVARGVLALLILAVGLVGIPLLLHQIAPLPGLGNTPGWDGLRAALASPDRGQLLLAVLTLAAWAGWVSFAGSTLIEVLALLRGAPTPRLPGLALPQAAAAALVASIAVLLTGPATVSPPPPSPTTATALAANQTPGSTSQGYADTGLAVDSHEPGPLGVLPARDTTTPGSVARSRTTSPQSPLLSGNQGASAASLPARAAKAGTRPRLDRNPTVTVHPGDSLWALAERHLGDGTRYRQIAQLNYGRPQPDGRQLSDAHWIYPGWILRLPPDAVDLPHHHHEQPPARPEPNPAMPPGPGQVSSGHASDPTDSHPSREPGSRVYIVRPGDTLWDIAATHLGDPSRYREIYQANHDRTQPDGQHLRDPALILPGWRLHLPARHPEAQHEVGHDTAAHHRHRQLETDRPSRGATLTPTAPGDPVVVPRPAGSSTPTATAMPGQLQPHPIATIPSTVTPSMVTGPSIGAAVPGAAEPASTVAAATGRHDGDDDPAPFGLLVAGLTAVAATGILIDLARRRRHQQRHRPTGHRIAMPTPGSATDTVERRLRATTTPATLTLIQHALSELTAGHLHAGAPLPAVALVRVRPDRLDLLLTSGRGSADPALMAPFIPTPAAGIAGQDRVTATGNHHGNSDDEGDREREGEGEGRERVGWWSATTDAIATCEEPPADTGFAYPALLTLGVHGDAILLANLDAAATLSLAGERNAICAGLRAYALELLTSPLCAGTTLHVGADLVELVEVGDPCRIQPLDQATTSALIEPAGPGVDVLAARAAGDSEADFTQVVLAARDELPDTHVRGAWSGTTAILTADSAEPAMPDRWVVHLSPAGARLEPFGLDLDAQHLDDHTYADLVELLATTARVAAPPTTADADADDPRAWQESSGTDHVADDAAADPPGEADATAEDSAAADADQNTRAWTPTADAETQHDTSVVQAPDGQQLDRPRSAPSPTAGVPIPTSARHLPARTMARPRGPAVAGAPRVLLLGTVRIDTGVDRPEPHSRRMSELVAYLALHPGTPAAALDDVLWNGQRIQRATRNSLVHRTRTWLGTAPDTMPYLPKADPTTRYRLHPAVSCDWYDFQQHTHHAATTEDDQVKAEHLQAGLDLIRDRPFLGVDPAGYAWADHDTQTMISAIVDAAHDLATLRLAHGDNRGAQEAATLGLFIDPVNELLYRDALRAAQARADHVEFDRLVRQLRTRLDDLDPDLDLEPQTIDLLTEHRQVAALLGRVGR